MFKSLLQGERERATRDKNERARPCQVEKPQPATMLNDHLQHKRQDQTESAIRINEEKLAQQRERRRQRDKSRLAQLTDDQLIKRKSQRRQYERNRVARMNDEQLKQYRAQKREQDRQRRRRQRERRFQHSSGIAHAQTDLKEGVQHHLIDVNANPTNAAQEITDVRDYQDISLMKEARERRNQRDKSRLAELTEDQVIKRKNQRRQYERNRVARMNDEQLKQYRARRREQERQRRQQLRETRFQYSRGTAHTRTELTEGVQPSLVDANANPTNAAQKITDVRDDQDICLLKEAAASADGDSGTDGQSAVGAAADGNPAADAGTIGQGDTEAAGTRVREAQIPIAAIPIRALYCQWD